MAKKISELDSLVAQLLPSSVLPVVVPGVTDTAKARAGLLGVPYPSFSALTTAAAAFNPGERAYLTGYWADSPGVGGGAFLCVEGTGLVSDYGHTIAFAGGTKALCRTSSEYWIQDFGALPEGDGASNHASLVVALALGRPLLVPDESFTISGDTLVATAALTGASPKTAAGSKFVCGTALAGPMLRYSASGGAIGNITFDGAGLADHCVEILNANLGTHPNVTVTGAKYDGVHYPISGNNLGGVWLNLKALSNGHYYETGTVSGSAGSTTLTFSGTVDLTTLGVRAAFDSIYFASEVAAQLAAGALAGNLHDINVTGANTATIYPPLAIDLVAATYSINMGSGVNIGPHSINGSQLFDGCLFASNADAGLRDSSLFGATCIRPIYEANRACGRVLGHQLGTAAYTASGTDVGMHYENSMCGAIQYASCYRPTLLPGFSTTSLVTAEPTAFAVWPFSQGPDQLTQNKSIRTLAPGLNHLLPELYSGRTGLVTADSTLALFTNANANWIIGETYEVEVAAGNLSVFASGGVATIIGKTLYGPGSSLRLTYTDDNEWTITGGWRPAQYTAATLPTALENEIVLCTDGDPSGAQAALVTFVGGYWRRSDGNLPALGLYGGYIAPASIPPSKIDPAGASPGDTIRWNGTAWVFGV